MNEDQLVLLRCLAHTVDQSPRSNYGQCPTLRHVLRPSDLAACQPRNCNAQNHHRRANSQFSHSTLPHIARSLPQTCRPCNMRTPHLLAKEESSADKRKGSTFGLPSGKKRSL